MAFVRVEQRNARLAAGSRRGGRRPRGPARQGHRRRHQQRLGTARARRPRSTGPSGASRPRTRPKYLGKGSHVNVVGRLRNNNYDKDGVTVYGFAFTAEEIDYLDSRGEREARSEAAKPGAAVPGKADGDDDVPF